MIPRQLLSLKNEYRNQCEYCKRYNLSYHFELKKIKGTAIILETYPVGRDKETIFKECYSPREKDYCEKRPIVGYTVLLKLEVSVPGKCHEDI